jgi:hypothetical protein
MKLNRYLTIGQKTYPVIEERVLLVLNDAGRAQFTVDAGDDAIAPGSPVVFELGYAQHAELSQLFLGYVEQSVAVGPRRRRLFCREWAAVLQMSVPLNLRHPTLKDVLTAIRAATQLNFSIPEAGYSTAKVPHFANLGNGYQALAAIGRVFAIEDYLWQQQGGGLVYVGSWPDSRWPERAVAFPDSIFRAHLSTQSAEIAAVPALRPGVLLNGSRLTRVEFAGTAMTITWK